MIIYRITNQVNGKAYIGQTKETRLSKRLNEHRTLKRGAIGAAFQKYGKDAFVVDVVEYCSDVAVDSREEFWITELKTLAPGGYNLNSGGMRPDYSSIITRQKMRVSAKRRAANPEWRSRMLRSGKEHSQYGKKQSQERITIRIRATEKRYIIVHPDGEERQIVNLSDFCRDRGLNIQTMCCIANGSGSAKSHQGFRVRKVE